MDPEWAATDGAQAGSQVLHIARVPSIGASMTSAILEPSCPLRLESVLDKQRSCSPQCRWWYSACGGTCTALDHRRPLENAVHTYTGHASLRHVAERLALACTGLNQEQDCCTAAPWERSSAVTAAGMCCTLPTDAAAHALLDAARSHPPSWAHAGVHGLPHDLSVVPAAGTMPSCSYQACTCDACFAAVEGTSLMLQDCRPLLGSC